MQILDLRTGRNGVPCWFHNCGSELFQQIGLLSGGLALVDFGCKPSYRLSELVSPWVPCSSQYPFCVWRKGHDSGPGCLQLLVSLTPLEMCQSHEIVWGICLGNMCSLEDWVFLSLWVHLIFRFFEGSFQYWAMNLRFSRIFSSREPESIVLLLWLIRSEKFL